MSEAEREKIVVESGGILSMFEVFYLVSLEYAAGRALDAFARYDALPKDQAHAEAVVATVQEALTHAAAVSRFFWPSWKRPVAKARGEKLRRAFALDDSSPLFRRDLRDALEHYDERLDAFLMIDRVGYMFPGAMVGDAQLADDRLGSIFRLVDSDTHIFVLLGVKYEFQPIRFAVEQLFARAATLSKNGGRLQPPEGSQPTT